MHHVTKPYNMSVGELSSRFQVICRLGRFLPGAWLDDGNTQPLYGTETEKKRALFQMMPMAWRIKFAETTHRLDNNHYSYHDLTNFMALQEAIDKRGRGAKRPRGNTSPGGRGRGRGNGHGRGNYGRGRGHGGYGNYNRPGSGGSGYMSPNPYINAAQGGRFQSYNSPQGRGF